jgi:methionyl-tRNA synthetase
MPKTTITAALPYANGPVHIGHLAGVYLPADTYARDLRLKGEETLFVCGSDEHGVPITLRAKKEGVTPQDVVDRYHAIIRDSFSDFDINFDVYSRTSAKVHHDTAQEFFLNLLHKGAFKEIVSEQFFDPEAQQFLADRYITGDCPKCQNPGAYGDQCEKCGSTLSPNELVNPKSALSGATPILKETKNWYLPLDELQESFLNQYIETRRDWRSTVLGQCKSWLNDGLKERAMTRDLNWGIPVPVENAEGKVLYVWFEAPIGYISATKEARPNDWESWWTGDSQLVHFIGKDNIVFHCIIFPAMLHLRGDGYIVPQQVPANEFLNLEGQKISTSRNWAVWLNEYLEELPNRQDELRFVLHSIAPETKDSEFTWKDYQTRVNSELVGILGNFANRVLVLMQKFYDGKVPARRHTQNAQELSERFIAPINLKLSQYKFRDALLSFMELARYGNKFLADNEPWKLVKTDPEKTEEIMQFAYEILCNLCIASEVFLPKTHQNLIEQLGLHLDTEIKLNFWAQQQWLIPSEGNQIGTVSLLFSKIEDAPIEAQIQKLHNNPLNASTVVETEVPTEPTISPKKEAISYEDFAKLDLRIARVKACEKVAKADKLLKLTLEVGSEECTVLSGIAQHFSPEEVIGKEVLYLYNLAPRMMRGIESQGMILMAEDSDGSLRFMQPSESVAAGSSVS